MRTILVMVILISCSSVKAQTFMPGSFMDYTQRQNFAHHNGFKDSASNKKYFLTTHGGLSTSFNFFKGGSETVVAAPLSLQLNRRINNNLYAFAGITVAPAYVNFNRSFLSANDKTLQRNSFSQSGSFAMYSRAEMGLMYVNDARTFSISGSIGIERSSYPVYPVQPINNTRSNPRTTPN